jgi:L-lactate dehydrogenase complex protein LldE
VRVSLFLTCFNDTLFPQTGRATVRLLERLGCEVDFPLEQTCCGQMHMNSGYAREGTALARRFARVFDGAEVVVTPWPPVPACCATSSAWTRGRLCSS